jgi:hypothetical protein
MSVKVGKLATKKAHFARYMGHRNGITHNSSIGNSYRFHRGQWVEIHEDDAEFFIKKSKSNDTWEHKKDTVKIMETHYYVRWMGDGVRQLITLRQVDKDRYGNALPNSIREYIFKKHIWVKLNKKDVGIFKQKADGNKAWQYEKAYLQKGIDPPATLGVIYVQEYFNQLMKKIDNPVVDEPKEEPQKSETSTEKVDPHLTKKEEVKLSGKKINKTKKEVDK